MLVKRITKVDPRMVFAIKTSTHTFIADGLLHHNCGGCNKWKSGNFIAYEEAMVKKYGIEVVNEIKNNYKNPMPINFNKREYLIGLMEKYKGLDSL